MRETDPSTPNLEDSRIQRLNAELKPGLRPGEGILDVRVEERNGMHVNEDHFLPEVVDPESGERGSASEERFHHMSYST